MLTMDERNQLFLAAHPDIRRKIRAEYRKAHPPVIVMAIKPKFAKAIYEGRKNWEFRKAPPHVDRRVGDGEDKQVLHAQPPRHQV